MEHKQFKFKICISTALNLSMFTVAITLHFINHTGDFPHSIFFFFADSVQSDVLWKWMDDLLLSGN